MNKKLYLGWIDHYQIKLDNFNENRFISLNKDEIEKCASKKPFLKSLPLISYSSKRCIGELDEVIEIDIKRNVNLHIEKFKENNISEFSIEDGEIVLFGDRDMTEQEKLDAYILKLNQDGPVVSFVGDNQVEIRLGAYIHQEYIVSYEVHTFLKEVIEGKLKMGFSEFLFKYKELKG